jgi:hypothetical protein
LSPTPFKTGHLSIGISKIYWNHSASCGHPPWEATWNDGIVECWNTGYKKRKKIYFIKNVVSTFNDDVRKTSIFGFGPRKYATIARISIQLNSFDTLNPPFHYPRAHDSNIPEFQHSI